MVAPWRIGHHRGAGDYRPDEHRIMLCTIVYPN
jgi:hypothetical protein